ncbi:MAG: HEAT repeat domain-containing protein [Promethearchaeota archaeon]
MPITIQDDAKSHLETCRVCNLQIRSGQRLVPTPCCGVTCHATCLSKWVAISGSCPGCRRPMRYQHPTLIVSRRASLAPEAQQAAPRIRRLVKALYDPTLRDSAKYELAKIGFPAVDSILPLLQDSDKWIRHAAIALCGKYWRNVAAYEVNKVVTAFIPLLFDEDVEVRRKATRALGLLRSPQVLEPLGTVLLHDSDSSVRETAAMILGYMKMKGVQRLLIEALHDDDSSVRASVLRSLGRLRDPRTIELFIKAMLNDPAVDPRYAAIWVLGGWPLDSQLVDPLITVLQHDPSIKMQERAITSLRFIGGKRVVELLITILNKPTKTLWGQAIHALGEIRDKRATEVLLKILRKDDKYSRCAAAIALRKIGDIRALATLQKILKREKDSVVRQYIRDAIKRLKRYYEG